MVSISLRRLGAWLRGTRHRKLLRQALGHSLGQDLRQDDMERESALLGLIAAQMKPWRQRPPLRGRQAIGLLQDLNASVASLFVFDLNGGQVNVWKKPASSRQPEAELGDARMFGKRVNHYRTLLTEVGRLHRSSDRSLLAMDLRDIPMACEEWPIFGFQKLKAATNLLLPDVDFFHHGWYLTDSDPLRYEDKSITACFVGSSTGAPLNAEVVRQHATPRLHFASCFLNDDRVLFRIAHAAHCDSDETRRLLMAQPYFSKPIGWGEQLGHRFLLSVDGNGAACSRVVKSLRSNGVLVKFQSEYELYYFALLQSGQHYLDVEHPEQVRRILDAESQDPGRYRAAATAGQAFAARYLTAPGVVHYTQLMLQRYAALLRDSDPVDANA
jgi:hypothetical protein